LPDSDDVDGLTPGATQLVEAAERIRRIAGHDHLCINHWLLAVMERYGPAAEGMVKGLGASALVRQLSASLRNGETRQELSRKDFYRDAWAHAGRHGKKVIESFDVVGVVLRNGGFAVDEYAVLEGTREGDRYGDGIYGSFRYVPRAQNPTPALDSMSIDLTREALDGRIVPLAGRKEEIALVMETLCRRTKRNPVLLGEAGVGKTAIVEGLALLVVQGRVPGPLRNVRILSLSIGAITEGSKYFGVLREKMEALLKDARQDGIILFLDEVHCIVHGGGWKGTSDIASCLKPVLSRGDVAIIAATTSDEYRKFIEQDSARERRFQPIPVHQLSMVQTRKVLQAHCEDLRGLRSIEIGGDTLDGLLEFSDRCMRNRSFPDKAIDLLEQCVANAVMKGAKEVTPEGIFPVVKRMVGMPMDTGKRLEAMKEQVLRLSLLSDEDADALYRRLHIAFSGINLQPNRPNAVVLMAGEAADTGMPLGESIAESLFGGKDRLVTIDFSRFHDASDLGSLLGSTPGWDGYCNAVPLHQVKTNPWCVLLCENIDAAHPRVLGILSQALRDGYFPDGAGKRIYLSDAVVLLTAMQRDGLRHFPGFHGGDDSGSERKEAILERLGKELLSACHLVCAGKPAAWGGACGSGSRSAWRSLRTGSNPGGCALRGNPGFLIGL